MLGVDLVGTWYKLLIPAIVSRLVAADQQNGNAARIEGKKRAVRPSAMLSSQLLHIRIPRRRNHVSMRPSQTRPALTEKVDAGSDVFLFRFAESIPPSLELIGELDFPCHVRNITYKECFIKPFFGLSGAVPLW
jgi:hypothetical protein